jgi:halimadienyl-diphosphate synthase
MKYLETVLAHSVGAISVYPFRTFELSWVLNNLAFSGIPLRTFADEDIWQELQAAMGRDGAGMDPEFGIPDGDTTSVCCRVLLEAGYEVEPLILAEFEDKREGIFHTWEYERNFSVSTNVHALEALNLMPEYPNHQQIQEQLIIKLLNNREYNVYWKDKWHASPYYTTSHALLALLPQGSSVIHACHHAVDWLTHTQHNDGSWGYFGVGTLEETAYTLTALLHYNRYQQIDLGSIHSGVHYLIKTYEEFKTKLDLACPELWIAKSLFAPYDVIRSAVLSTLIVYNKMFGRLPG